MNKLCPLCDKPAVSPHHIKPRSQGGTDDPRNIVMLCKSCHDEVEGQNFTPDLISNKRRQNVTGASKEEYWYINRDNCLLFLGVKLPHRDQLIHFYISFPKDSGLDNIIEDTIRNNLTGNPDKDLKYIKKLSKRGRPLVNITYETIKEMVSDGKTLTEVAREIGVSYDTVKRRYAKSGMIGITA